MAEQQCNFVPTKASILKKNSAQTFEHVSFSDRKALQKSKNINVKKSVNITTSMENTPDLKKLRYDIIKFGSNAFDHTNKEASSIALAVALGAKPPKRKYENYKDILKKQKTEEKHKPVTNNKKHLYVVGNKVIPAKPNTKNGSKKILDPYGKVNVKGRNKKGKRRKI